jgi:hypothetical protein
MDRNNFVYVGLPHRRLSMSCGKCGPKGEKKKDDKKKK